MILVKGWYIRRPGIVAVAVNLTIAAGIVILVQAIIRSTVSESQEISLFLKKILPAGNCLCQSSTTFDCKLSSSEATTYENGGRELSASLESGWRFQFGRDDLNLGMSDSQCMSAFPGLFEDIYRAVALRLDQNTYVSAHDLNSIELSRGMVRAMIVERKLVVLESQHMDQDHRKKGLATLQAIQRSISISGKSLPNIEFVFSIEDMVQNLAEPLWTLARRPQDENLWLMPDFGFWSWDIEDLGPFDSVVQRVIRDEINVPWPVKIQKLVWRGALRRAPKLRRALLDACRDKTWSDVEVLVETAPSIFGNYVSAADQCKYMFLAHAEGEYIFIPLFTSHAQQSQAAVTQDR
jgi:hypothetical protein